MGEWLIPAATVLCTVLFTQGVVGMVRTFRANKRRVDALRSLIWSHGWLTRSYDPSLRPRWHGYPFDKGHSRRVTTVVTGQVGPYAMVAFDYEYTRVGSDEPDPAEFAICALAMPCALPELHVAPEPVFSRMGETAGMYEVELESEDFNRRYRVRCRDPKLAADVLTPRTMEALLRVPELNVRFAGTDALCVTKGRLEAAALLDRVAALVALVDGIPASVWEAHGLVGPPASPGGAT